MTLTREMTLFLTVEKMDPDRKYGKIALVTTRNPSPLSVHRHEERVFFRHTQEKSDRDLHSAKGVDSARRRTQHHHLRRGRSKLLSQIPI